MADAYDVAIIGGGIVSLATARALGERAPRARLAIVEKEAKLAQHQTGHNSGVIHSGIYYKPGSYKARLCVEGARLVSEFCAEHGIRVERCGKVIVATRDDEVPRLQTLYERGTANGVPGLAWVDQARLRELEPHAAAIKGIHSPNTAIVDFGEVAAAFARELSGRGVTIETNAVLAFAREGYRFGRFNPAEFWGTLSYPGFWAMARRYWRTGAYEVYRSLSPAAFVRALQRLVPDLRPDDVVRGGAGVRAQAVLRDGSLVDDFRIVESADAIHVLNAPSPAATASLVIGRHIAGLAAERFGLK